MLASTLTLPEENADRNEIRPSTRSTRSSEPTRRAMAARPLGGVSLGWETWPFSTTEYQAAPRSGTWQRRTLRLGMAERTLVSLPSRRAMSSPSCRSPSALVAPPPSSPGVRRSGSTTRAGQRPEFVDRFMGRWENPGPDTRWRWWGGERERAVHPGVGEPQRPDPSPGRAGRGPARQAGRGPVGPGRPGRRGPDAPDPEEPRDHDPPGPAGGQAPARRPRHGHQGRGRPAPATRPRPRAGRRTRQPGPGARPQAGGQRKAS